MEWRLDSITIRHVDNNCFHMNVIQPQVSDLGLLYFVLPHFVL